MPPLPDPLTSDAPRGSGDGAGIPIKVPGFDATRCAQYLVGTDGAPPRAQLMQALAVTLAPSVPRRALDLGCGPGRETLALLHAGFEVVAIDPYAEMILRTRRLLQSDAAELVHRAQLFETTLELYATSIRHGAFGLVHAGFVLPFVLPTDFALAFDSLRAGIAKGGLFVGQFFGPNDEFIRESGRDVMTCQTAEEVDRLFDGFEILSREEVDREGHIGRGRAKWWHVHHIVARRE